MAHYVYWCIYRYFGSLFYMVGFLWALSNHCPSLLHPLLHRGTLGRRHLEAVLPGGHLGVGPGGRLEPLQGLREAGSRLDGGLHDGVDAGVVVAAVGGGGVVVGGPGGVCRVVRGVRVVGTGSIHLSVCRKGWRIIIPRGFIPTITFYQRFLWTWKPWRCPSAFWRSSYSGR